MLDFVTQECGHVVRPPLMAKTMSDLPPCPTCAEIKASYESGQQDEHYAMEETVMNLVRKAEDKRGEEVLELACKHLPGSWDVPLRQAYKERYERG